MNTRRDFFSSLLGGFGASVVAPLLPSTKCKYCGRASSGNECPSCGAPLQKSTEPERGEMIVFETPECSLPVGDAEPWEHAHELSGRVVCLLTKLHATFTNVRSEWIPTKRGLGYFRVEVVRAQRNPYGEIRCYGGDEMYHRRSNIGMGGRTL